MARTRKVGFGIESPSRTCDDVNCPFHGTLKTRGKQFTGKVVSDKMQKAVIVQWIGWRRIPKYERYRKTKTKVVAHNPPCIDAKEGDIVKILECRPLSKTKNFVVVHVQGKAEKYELEKGALEEGKHKEKEKVKAKESPAASAKKAKARREEQETIEPETDSGPEAEE
jgi:small subunit ribosomal protein S17